MPNPKPPYPAQFREQMVELVRAVRKPGELAKEFGCHVTSILSWVRLADEVKGNGSRKAIVFADPTPETRRGE